MNEKGGRGNKILHPGSWRPAPLVLTRASSLESSPVSSRAGSARTFKTPEGSGHCKAKIVMRDGKIFREKIPTNASEIANEMLGHFVARVVLKEALGLPYMEVGVHLLDSLKKHMGEEELFVRLKQQRAIEDKGEASPYTMAISTEHISDFQTVESLLKKGISAPQKGFCASVLIRLLLCDNDPNLGNFGVFNAGKADEHIKGIDYAEVFSTLPTVRFPKDKEEQKEYLVNYIFKNQKSSDRDKVKELVDISEVDPVMHAFYDNKDAIRRYAEKLANSSEVYLKPTLHCVESYLGKEPSVSKMQDMVSQMRNKPCLAI